MTSLIAALVMIKLVILDAFHMCMCTCAAYQSSISHHTLNAEGK